MAIRIDESKDRKEQRKNTNETGHFEMIFKFFSKILRFLPSVIAEIGGELEGPLKVLFWKCWTDLEIPID